jgi:hypothetical protein
MNTRALVALPLIFAACGGGGEKAAASRPWADVIKENSAGLEALRAKLPLIKAAIDANPDAKAYGKCAPSPQYSYAPLGTAAEHNLDFIDYGRLATGGRPDFNAPHREFDLLPATSLSLALYWSHPETKTFAQPTATAKDIARMQAAQGVKLVVVVKERPDSKNTAVNADSFLVSLEPMKVLCVFSIGAEGKLEGTPQEKYIEETYNKKTGQTISTREVTTGGEYTTDATYEARNEEARAAWKHLGVTPAACGGNNDCIPYELTSCSKGACRPDDTLKSAATKKEDDLRAEYDRVKPIFEATTKRREECKQVFATPGASEGSPSPYGACLEKLWAEMETEGTKLKIPRDTWAKHHETWNKEHGF